MDLPRAGDWDCDVVTSSSFLRLAEEGSERATARLDICAMATVEMLYSEFFVWRAWATEDVSEARSAFPQTVEKPYRKAPVLDDATQPRYQHTNYNAVCFYSNITVVRGAAIRIKELVSCFRICLEQIIIPTARRKAKKA